MIVERFPEIAALPNEEKRILVSELCEDLASSKDGADPAIVRILEERWSQYEANPSSAITLEEFRKRIATS